SISKNAIIRPDITRPVQIIFFESVRMTVLLLRGRQAADFQYGADLDRAPSPGGDLPGDLDRFIEVLRFNQEEAAQLLARFSKRAVGDQLSAVANANAGGGRGGVQRGGLQVLPLLMKLPGIGRGILVTLRIL